MANMYPACYIKVSDRKALGADHLNKNTRVEIICASKHETRKGVWRDARTHRYKEYPNQLKRIKRGENCKTVNMTK